MAVIGTPKEIVAASLKELAEVGAKPLTEETALVLMAAAEQLYSGLEGILDEAEALDAMTEVYEEAEHEDN